MERRPQEIEQPQRENTSIYKDYHEVNKYLFIDDCYTGKGGVSGNTENGDYSYILANPTELFYKTRVKNTPYLNFVKKFVSAPINPVFKEGIKVSVSLSSSDKELPETFPFVQFLNNITGTGIDLAHFQKQLVLPNAYKDGVVFVVMEKTDIEPYCILRKAIDVNYYLTDDKGNLTEIAFYNGETKSGDKTYYKWIVYGIGYTREYTSESLSAKAEDWTLTSEEFNNYGVLPVKPVFATDRSAVDEYLPDTPTYEVAKLTVKIYDLLSDLNWLLKKAGFPRLIINGNINGIGYAPDNVLVIPESNSGLFQPYLLTPDSAIIKAHIENLQYMKDELFELMEENGVSAQPIGNQPESGVSKAYEFIATNNALLETINICQDLNRWIYETYRIMQGEQSGDYKLSVIYPENFQPTAPLSVDDTIKLLDYLTVRGLNKTLKAVEKNLVLKAMPKIDDAEFKEISDEIESTDIVGGIIE